MIDPATISDLYAQHGSLRAIARAKGWAYSSVQAAYATAVSQSLMPVIPMGAKTHAHHKTTIVSKQRVKALRAKRTRHRRYILTCAQNNTNVHAEVWKSLKTLAKHYGAEIFVSAILYSKRGLGARNDKAQLKTSAGYHKTRDQDEIWFDPAIVPYINNDRVEIAKGLVWCGELNISPTAARPLSGLESYTGRASMVVPHTHIAMQSIATVGGAAKLNYTTGAVTLRNYIQRKEGFKAEFHHCYGGLLVEVDDDGHWWVRQLNADSDGTIYDLDVKVSGGKVTTGNRVEAITFGDVHVANIDADVAKATWRKGGMVDKLRPRFQIVHDVLDFYSRSHHTIKDPYKKLARHVSRKESVQEELLGVAGFLRKIARSDCQTIVVDSNHDRHLDRWLRENDGRFDPVNARYWSALNARLVEYISEHGHEPENMLAFAYEHANLPARFLTTDTSFVICQQFGGGIECALHGDQGANGARGGIRQFAKMGRRSNVGHSHSAGIDGGCWQTGTKSKLKLEYNHGLSSWTHSDIITYANGKRAIVTFFNNKWRA